MFFPCERTVVADSAGGRRISPKVAGAPPEPAFADRLVATAVAFGNRAVAKYIEQPSSDNEETEDKEDRTVVHTLRLHTTTIHGNTESALTTPQSPGV